MQVSLTPLEFARRARALYGDHEAVVDGDARWTYTQFFDRCDRWSAALKALGIQPLDRVAYIAPNCHAQLESFYSVPQMGAVLVPINYRLTADDFAYLINHSGARMICAHSDYLAAIDSIRSQIPGVEYFVALDKQDKTGWLSYEMLVAQTPPLQDFPEIDENELLTINYTSGTTSRPKGVMITHRNAYMNVVGTLIHVHMTSAERYLWTLPMFHANGWTFVWTVTAVGGAHVCLPKVDPELVRHLINRESISFLCAAPSVLISIANATRDVRRGVRVLVAGAPPAAVTLARIEAGLGWEVTHVYGLTETAPFISICEPRESHRNLTPEEHASVKARQGVELITSGALRVVDHEDYPVPRDGKTLGEIVVRGNVVMAGYYQDPEATAQVFRGGWMRTGDAAVVHPDGYMEIQDRLKDVIISGGENISSVEVECILLRHLAIREVAVVGVPDQKWGEVPCAFVVMNDGKTATPAELREFARQNMAHFKVPKEFHIVAELPKTATGKMQKNILRRNRSAISLQ